jgi:hypothetical protein
VMATVWFVVFLPYSDMQCGGKTHEETHQRDVKFHPLSQQIILQR